MVIVKILEIFYYVLKFGGGAEIRTQDTAGMNRML